MSDGAFDLTIENDSVIVVAGIANSHDFDVTNNPGGDVWLLKFNLDNTTSTNEFNFQNELIISPNPSSGAFKIKVPDNSKNCTIKITDIAGKTIYFSANEKIIEGMIDIPMKTNSGVCFLHSIIDGKEFLNKIIVQN